MFAPGLAILRQGRRLEIELLVVKIPFKGYSLGVRTYRNGVGEMLVECLLDELM